jgi:hypothetical protein
MTHPDKSITFVGNRIKRASVEFTNTSGSGTAYSIGDVVSGGSPVVAPYEITDVFREKGGSAYIVGAMVGTDKSSIVPQLRLNLFNSTVVVPGDNSLYKPLYTMEAARLGWVDVDATSSGSDTSGSYSGSAVWNIEHPIVAASNSTSLFVTVETRTAFTPAATSEKYTVTLFVKQN